LDIICGDSPHQLCSTMASAFFATSSFKRDRFNSTSSVGSSLGSIDEDVESQHSEDSISDSSTCQVSSPRNIDKKNKAGPLQRSSVTHARLPGATSQETALLVKNALLEQRLAELERKVREMGGDL